MTAKLFALTQTPESGVVVAFALLCPDARYTTVRWAREPRLERRSADPATWRSVIADLNIGWQKGIVAPASATARTLLREDVAGWHLQWVTDLAVDFSDDPGDVAVALDELLKQQPL